MSRDAHGGGGVDPPLGGAVFDVYSADFNAWPFVTVDFQATVDLPAGWSLQLWASGPDVGPRQLLSNIDDPVMGATSNFGPGFVPEQVTVWGEIRSSTGELVLRGPLLVGPTAVEPTLTDFTAQWPGAGDIQLRWVLSDPQGRLTNFQLLRQGLNADTLYDGPTDPGMWDDGGYGVAIGQPYLITLQSTGFANSNWPAVSTA